MRLAAICLLFILPCLSSCGGNATDKTTNTETVAAAPAKPASKLNEAGTGQLMTVVSDYYEIKNAFVATSAVKADSAANKLIASTEAFRTMLKSDTAANYANIILYTDTIIDQSKQMLTLKDETCEKKRVNFEKISDAMFPMLKQAELKNAGVYRQFCPMAFNDKGAFWLSNEEEIKNPYFGKKMLECGEITDSLK